jgi:hypothetical protein
VKVRNLRRAADYGGWDSSASPVSACSKTTIQPVFIEQMNRFAEFAVNPSSAVNSSTIGKTK